MGYHAHGMSGIQYELARAELGMPERYALNAACVIGRIGDPAQLDEKLRAREHPVGPQAARRVRPCRGSFPAGLRACAARRLRVNIRRLASGGQAMTVEAGAAKGRMVTLPARPEPIRVSADETAIVVIDMQNAYASPGGYVDLAGFDISGAAGTIGQIAKVLETARAAGMPIVYLQNGWDPDYVEAGGPGSPNWHKSNALKTMRARPELQGKLLARGGWDYALVDALAPQAGRHRPRQDPLQRLLQLAARFSTLRARGIRNIVFVGIATNVCVESTLRDGFHLEYFGVMLEDATHHLGPDFIQAASVYNVEKFFGWVSTVADFCGTFGQIRGMTTAARSEPRRS